MDNLDLENDAFFAIAYYSRLHRECDKNKLLQVSAPFGLPIPYSSPVEKISPDTPCPVDTTPFELRNKYFEEAFDCCISNDLYADYYEYMFGDEICVGDRPYTDDEIFGFDDWFPVLNPFISPYHKKSERMRNCHKIWTGDLFPTAGYFDLHKTSLCGDKFCENCQKLKQASLLNRFFPVIAELQKQYDLYHITFTVENCSGNMLHKSLRDMSRAFTLLTRYFSGKVPLRFLDLSEYGYAGCIRNFEIVCKSDTEYHPHIHSLWCLQKDLDMPKFYKNPYSYDKGKFKQAFSFFEVVLQRLFRLLYDGNRVCGSTFDDCKLGYSVLAQKVDGESWHEVFKYITKLSSDDGKRPFLTYTQFSTLYHALDRFRALQGYGCFYGLDFDSLEQDDIDTVLYSRLLTWLNSIEDPVRYSFELQELLRLVPERKLKVISRKLLYQLAQKKSYM